MTLTGEMQLDAGDTSPTSPLLGIRVIDFTHIFAGPYCTQLLADAGADVIKVEPPGGEFSRNRGPRRRGSEDGDFVTSFYAATNRGKRSIALDLKMPRGIELANRLAAQADVVVENFAPGVLKRIGVDLDELRRTNPRVVTASISLFGREAADRSISRRAGLAIVAESESGFVSMNRDSEGRPIAFRLPLGDMATGLNAYAALTTALYARERSGVGSHLDISMVATLISLNCVALTNAQIPATPGEGRSPAGYGIFPTNDGHVSIGVNSDVLFARLAAAMDRPDLANDPRYRSHAERDARAHELNAIITGWSLEQASDTIVELAERAGVPCGRVNTPKDIIDGAAFEGVRMLDSVDDGFGGLFETASNPMGFTPPSMTLSKIGEQADEILTELGISADERVELRLAGVLGRTT